VKQFLSVIRKNEPVAEGYNLLEFEWPSEPGLEFPAPGQFITVWNRVSTDPLLRRPFAVSACNASNYTCQIVYQIRGKGTQALAALQNGDCIDVIGPLGKCFPPPPPGKTPFLLAGGVGFGPIYYLANNFADQGVRSVTIIGARTASLVPDVPYKRLGDGTELFHFCTDDGSRGFSGTVIDLLKSFAYLTPDAAEMYACGPLPMLSAATKLAEAAGIQCWVSMEQIMGCGVGACMGCAIRAREPGKYVRVCTEGPVFNARDLLW